MNRHFARRSAFVLANTLLWGVVEAFALLRSRWSHPRHPLQG